MHIEKELLSRKLQPFGVVPDPLVSICHAGETTQTALFGCIISSSWGLQQIFLAQCTVPLGGITNQYLQRYFAYPYVVFLVSDLTPMWSNLLSLHCGTVRLPQPLEQPEYNNQVLTAVLEMVCSVYMNSSAFFHIFLPANLKPVLCIWSSPIRKVNQRTHLEALL